MRNRDFTLGDVIMWFVVSPIIVFLICLFLILGKPPNWFDEWMDSLPLWIELPLAFILVTFFIGPLTIFIGIPFAIGTFFAPLFAIHSFFTSTAEYSRPHFRKRLRNVLVTVGFAVVGLNVLILLLMDPPWWW